MLSQIPRSAISLAVGFVHQMAVLDALHAGGDRPLDRGGRVGMHGDVGAPVLGGFDGGAQLGSVKVVTSSGLCGDATPPPAVSLICVAPSMSCSRTRTRTSSGLSATMAAPSCSPRDQRRAEGARQFERLAEVAVAAGDGDDGAGRVDARAGDECLRRWRA